jgi:hypothetical protein
VCCINSEAQPSSLIKFSLPFHLVCPDSLLRMTLVGWACGKVDNTFLRNSGELCHLNNQQQRRFLVERFSGGDIFVFFLIVCVSNHRRHSNYSYYQIKQRNSIVARPQGRAYRWLCHKFECCLLCIISFLRN